MIAPERSALTASQRAVAAEVAAAALSLPPNLREGFVRERCADDSQVVSEVLSLLRHLPGSETDSLLDAAHLQPGADSLPASGDGVHGLADSNLRTPEPVPPPWFPRPGDTLGPYRLTGVLGEGAYGVVFRAEQAAPLQRAVAIKVLRAVSAGGLAGGGGDWGEGGGGGGGGWGAGGGGGGGAILARFDAERRTLGRMDHPNIATIHNAGQTQYGLPYFVMELVPGGPITTACAERSLPLRTRLQLLAQACDGVAHAHARGVIHRDLKPGNILVKWDGDPSTTPVVKVIDFGVAKARAGDRPDLAEHTQRGELIGTLAYMSPEAAGGDVAHADARSDVFSLGIVLFELLSGTLPRDLRRRSLPEALRAVEATDSPSVRAADPSIPRELDLIARKALSNDPGHRYQSAAALADDLRRYLDHRPIVAHPPSAAYRVRKFARRNKASVLALVAVFCTLAAATAVSSAGFAEARRAEQTARLEAYRLNIVAAESALRAGETGRAQRRLAACPPDLRAWEWHYLTAESDHSLGVLCSHNRAVRSAAFSHDASRIVTAANDGTAKVWRVPDGEILAECRIPGGPSIRGAAFSPDGREVLTASEEGRLLVWDADTGELRRTIADTPEPLNACAWASDGAIAAAYEDGTVRLWRGDAAPLTLTGHAREVNSIAFSDDGRRVLTGSGDATARLWSADSGALVATLDGHPSPIRAAVFSPSGSMVATTSEDGSARVWRDGHTIHEFTHDAPVWSAAFTPDERSLATGTRNGLIRVWTLDTREPPRELAGHIAEVTSLAFSPDGALLLSASGEGTVRLWDARATPPPGAGQVVARGCHRACPSPDGAAFIAIDNNGEAIIRSVESGVDLKLPLPSPAIITAVTYDPRGRLAAGGTRDGHVCFWDAATGERLLAVLAHRAPVSYVAFNRDGSRLVSTSIDRTARLWCAKTGRPLATLAGHAGEVHCASFSPDGARVVTGDHATARVWEATRDRRTIELIGHSKAVSSAIFSPDHRHILTTSYDGTIRLWDAVTGRQLSVAHEDSGLVTSAAFDPSGTRFVITSYTGSIRVWEVASFSPLVTLRQHGDPMGQAVFTDDGRSIMAVTQTGTVLLWTPTKPR